MLARVVPRYIGAPSPCGSPPPGPPNTRVKSSPLSPLPRWTLGSALTAIPAPPFHRLFAAADRLRRAALTKAAPLSRGLIVDRERRVAFIGTALIAAAFAATCVVPLWMIALGPLVWGVPHILADIRYLIARPGYHRRPAVLIAIAGGAAATAAGYGVRGGLASAGAVLLLSRGTAARRAIGVAVVAGLFALAQWAGPIADLAFAHLHNFVAVALWWAWRPRDTKLHWLPLLLFVTGAAALLYGAAEPALRATGGLDAPWTGLSMESLAYSLSPGPRSPLAIRLVLLYAFAQSVHYIVWLRLIPEDDRRSHTPRSYQQSYRVLLGDVGPIVLWLTAAGVLVFAVWALFTDAGAARNAYLNVAFFHGDLELAAAALLFSEARLWSRDSQPEAPAASAAVAAR